MLEAQELLDALSGVLVASALTASTLPRVENPPAPRALSPTAEVTRRDYLSALVTMGLLSTLALTFDEFAFKLVMAREFIRDAHANGSFLSTFYDVVFVLALITLLFLAGPL